MARELGQRWRVGTQMKDLRILDVAAGSGAWSISFAQADPGTHVTALAAGERFFAGGDAAALGSIALDPRDEVGSANSSPISAVRLRTRARTMRLEWRGCSRASSTITGNV